MDKVYTGVFPHTRMEMRYLIGWIALLRLPLCFFGVIGYGVSIILAGIPLILSPSILAGGLIVFISMVGTFALNDYLDIEIDTINNRVDRPLTQGIISPKAAFQASIVCMFLVVSLSFFLPRALFLPVILHLLLFYAYNFRLKRIPVLKNLLVAYSYSATILFGAVITGLLSSSLLLFFALLGFIVGFGSEVLFDLIDSLGDTRHRNNTLPSMVNPRTVALIPIFCFGLIIFLDPVPYFIPLDSRLYLNPVFLGMILPVLPMYLYVIIRILRYQVPQDLVRLRFYVFFIMQYGTLAYLLGVVL